MNYDIEALKRKMLVKYPFFGSVVAGVSYKAIQDIPTAGTDGETIYYNNEFLEKLSVDEQTFIFAHEVCHIAFNHILRSEGKNQELWNIATDGVINQFLKRDGLKMVAGGVDIAEAINYDAEELYEKLLKEKQQNQSGGNSNQQSQSGQSSEEQQSQGQSSSRESSQENRENSGKQDNSGSNGNSQNEGKDSQEKSANGSGESTQEEEKKQQDAGHDTHSMWSDAVKKHKEQQQKEKEKNKSNQESNKKDNTDDKKTDKGKDKQDNKSKGEKENNKEEEPKTISEKEAFKKNREEKKKNLEKLKEEIYNKASGAGTTTNMDVRNVGDIGYAKPIIDWRYALREAIKYDVDWSYKNATIEEGVVTPHLEEQPMPETEIVIDTSGSINTKLLRSFLRECKNILKHSKLRVGCFDTKFYGFNEIRVEKDIDDMKFVGGGGTNFDVAVNAFSRRVENKIIFTDGEASMPAKALNAIWIVFGNRKIDPKGGRVIHITPDQFNKLCSYKVKTKTRY